LQVKGLNNLDEGNYIKNRELCSYFTLPHIVEKMDYKLADSGMLYNILFSDKVDEFVGAISERMLVKLMKQSTMSPMEEFQCIHKYISTAGISQLEAELYNYVSFLFCFLLNDGDKETLSSQSPLNTCEWFCRINQECSDHLALPIHQQVLVKDDKFNVQDGDEGLLVLNAEEIDVDINM